MGEEGGAGETIGDYVLDEPIASGGLATVYRAHRADGAAGPPLAAKRLRPQYAKNPELVAMFLEEARLVRRLRHPNVVGLLDVVTTEAAGELCLVLEYVAGSSLAELSRAVRARGEPFPPEIVSSIATGLLRGLHAAHEARDDAGRPLGIVHRDVSPENVLVGSDGLARVLDFGIAKAIDRALPTTRLGGLKGKMAYMAPEQLTASPAPDRRADLWAAAVVVWEMLARRRLFAEESRQGLFRMILEEPIPAPSLVAPCTSALDAVLRRALSRAPADRFATAEEMARAIAAAVPPAAPPAVGAWVAERAARRKAPAIAPEEATGAAHGRVGTARAPEAPAVVAAPAPSRSPSGGRERAIVVAAVAVIAVLGLVAVAARRQLRGAAPVASGTASSPPREMASELPADFAARNLPPASSTSAAHPPAGGARPRANCQPPYRIGPSPDYIRTPKPECFSR